MKITKFDNNSDKVQFYAYMGKYFAETKYKKDLKYIVNRSTNIWFVMIKSGYVIGFGAVNVLKNKVVLEHSYVEEEYRGKGIWKVINNSRLNFAHSFQLPIEVITKEEHLQKYWMEIGFTPYRKNGRYTYLRKEVDKNEKN